MSYDNDSYQRQNQLLDNLDRQFDALNGYLDTSRDNYQNQIRTMASIGFMTNYTDRLNEKFSVFSGLIDNLHETIGRSKTMIDLHEGHIDDLRRQSTTD